MTAHRLLQEVRNRDIRITAQGEHLIVHARRGALTPALREALQTHKCEVIAELRTKADPHRDNESIAEVHGLTLADLEQVAGSEWLGINDDPTTLEALACAIQIRRMRERGETPPRYTATTTCRHCGEVPIFKGAGEHVLGCPWCLNRMSGKPIPRSRQRLT